MSYLPPGFTLLPLLLTGLLLPGCTADGDPSATRFTRLAPDRTGIDFVNETGENDTFNILTNEYIYNGGGVGIGDFDGDGLPDVFLSGCATRNRLYRNRGDFRFEDITTAAGVAGGDRWNNGVTVVDVNGDGREDIYVCATTRDDPGLRANQLFLNQGNDAAGHPTFRDVAPAYGIADTTHNTQAAWLDYDGDGDLDLFLLVNEMVDNKRPNDFNRKVRDGSGPRTDKLYRQDRRDGAISFTEVGKETGILYQGFALAVSVCDLNRDGWPDLYVSNDYLSNDLAYLNVARPDGSRYFVDVAAAITKHTSYSAMGNDVADLNNDGMPDIVAVDMLPADNLRRKMMLAANNYTYLINLDRYDYHPQFTRNTLQISQGRRVDSLRDLPNYAEVAMQSGLPATDWSWTPLVADFDLDGRKDVIITNGFPRDITDKDFADYNLANNRFYTPGKLLEKIPSVKIPNVAFRASGIADGIPRFEDVSQAWGIEESSFSNGAAYADLDGDGDLDYVVNNIYDPAHVYRNNTIGEAATGPNFVRVTCPGGSGAACWGTEITLTTEAGTQHYYLHPHRGYLSSSQPEILIGLGDAKEATLTFSKGSRAPSLAFTASPGVSVTEAAAPPVPQPEPVVRAAAAPGFRHHDLDFIDFNVQPMLLRKLTQQGPGLAVTDWNDDGIEDVYVSGSYENPGAFLQGTGAGFREIPSPIQDDAANDNEELGALFFDADGDGDDDLYVVSGSYERPLADGDYADRFYENAAGRYVRRQTALPDQVPFSGSCVRAADYDGDGDLDLFVGARVAPHAYPTPVSSLLLRNESAPGSLRFVADPVAGAALGTATNVSDALFTDYDNDGDADLLLAGEWSPLRLYANEEGTFREVTAVTGLGEHQGWWNALAAGDFDNDGDTDYLAGNLGTNSILRPSPDEPVTATLTDLDDNGGMDFIPFAYFTAADGTRKRFPFFNRNDFAKQVTMVKGTHPTHAAYAAATAEAFLGEGKERFDFTVTTSTSYYLENTPDGFAFRPLPAPAQSFPVFGMLPLDLNADDLLDLLVIGNDHGCETSQGFMDAGNGLALINRGDGFTPLPPSASGFSVPGEGRALVRARGSNGVLIVAAQNGDSLRIFRAGERGPEVTGRKTERYWGSGYLGQSGK